MVKSIVEESGIAPESLDLELTESTVMSRGEAAIGVMQSLKENGYPVWLSTTSGTGYSSLSYLRHFPLDILKIDRSFARGLESNEVDVAIVRAVIDLSHAVGLTVVAEGVENVGQERILRDLGCDIQQGYLFSPPVCAEDMDAILATPHRLLLQISQPTKRAA